MTTLIAQGPVDVNVSRQCTCHPDDNPPTPCAKKYAFRECAEAAGLAVVYGDENNWFFSDGVKRDFGKNKVVKLLDGESVLCSVQPLRCEPLECGLRIIGMINRDG